MIVREQDDVVIMMKQHDHGLLAGDLARYFKEEHVPEEGRREEVLHAIGQHDRGWIDLDETPFWNDAENAPYSFMDFPVVPKLNFYKKGLDEIEQDTLYGALLCSLHFERLIEVSSEQGPELSLYQEREAERRARIHRELEETRPLGEDELYYDARLLQFCDDLSLYMGLNEPGSPKSEEHPWWVDGFSGSEDFSFTSGRVISTEWKDASTLVLDPFPFSQDVEVAYKLRKVPKSEIKLKGIALAYSETPEEEYRITVAGQPE
ncbi:DUF3891 family protein [Paenibacillus donghaensis]|nr:DUF3891 family protein [Paenibacillus donghaensis]